MTVYGGRLGPGVKEEAIIADVHPTPVQLQDRPKDLCDELIVFNLKEKGKESHHIFISAILSVNLK